MEEWRKVDHRRQRATSRKPVNGTSFIMRVLGITGGNTGVAIVLRIVLRVTCEQVGMRCGSRPTQKKYRRNVVKYHRKNGDETK